MAEPRRKTVMLRFTEAEFEIVSASAKAADQEVAVFLRERALEAIRGPKADPLRPVAAFIVAALSSEIEFSDALNLFDSYVHDPLKG